MFVGWLVGAGGYKGEVTPGPNRYPPGPIVSRSLRAGIKLPTPPQAGGPRRKGGAPAPSPPPTRGCAIAHSVKAQARGGAGRAREGGRGVDGTNCQAPSTCKAKDKRDKNQSKQPRSRNYSGRSPLDQWGRATVLAPTSLAVERPTVESGAREGEGGGPPPWQRKWPTTRYLTA